MHAAGRRRYAGVARSRLSGRPSARARVPLQSYEILERMLRYELSKQTDDPRLLSTTDSARLHEIGAREASPKVIHAWSLNQEQKRESSSVLTPNDSPFSLPQQEHASSTQYDERARLGETQLQDVTIRASLVIRCSMHSFTPS